MLLHPTKLQIVVITIILGYSDPSVVQMNADFHYLKKVYMDQTIQKHVVFILNSEALTRTHLGPHQVCNPANQTGLNPEN